MATIKETSTQFTVNDYFENRVTIIQAMSAALNVTFNTTLQNTVQLFDYQLRKVSFDDTFEDAITQKLIQSQNQNTVLINQQLLVILSQIQLIQNQGYNNVSIITGTASATGAYQIAVAQATATSLRMNQLATWYGYLFQNLSTTAGAATPPVAAINDTLKMELFWVSELPYLNNISKYYVGMNSMLVQH